MTGRCIFVNYFVQMRWLNNSYPTILQPRVVALVCKFHTQLFTSQVKNKESEKPSFLNPTRADVVDYFFCDSKKCNASSDGRREHCLSLMINHFQLSRKEGIVLLNQYPQLTREFLHKSFVHLSLMGLKKTTFTQHPFLITVTPEELDCTLSVILKNFPDLADINICAPLFSQSLFRSNRNVKDWIEIWKKESVDFPHPSKFHYLADSLKVPIAHILHQVETRKFLLSISHAKVSRVIGMLLEAGLSEKDLMADLRFLRSAESTMRLRIEALQEAKVVVKPWLLRATEENFQGHINICHGTRDAKYTFESIEAFLMKRLGCDTTRAAYITRTYSPHLVFKSIPKLDRILNYLLKEKGIDPTVLMSNPGVLIRSLDTVRKRVEVLEAAGLDLDETLWMLCKPTEKFHRLVERRKVKTCIL